MKKTLFIIIGIFIIILLALALALIGIESKNKVLREANAEYEFYLDKPIYGTELATLINKAIDNNNKYEVQKDESGLFIDNGQNSVLITIQMMGSSQIYEMEKVFALRN